MPLDYANPTTFIDLAVARVRARGPAERIGALMVSPGGPGGSGVAAALAAVGVGAFPRITRERFDFVGFDPRGVGKSPLVSCGDRLDLSSKPESRKTFTDACATSGGSLLGHLDTVTTANDMERVRQALGEDRISFLGYSYASQLGLAYAQRYSDHVRAMILDSPIDPATSPVQRTTDALRAYERTLDEFLKVCTAVGRKCAFNDGSDLQLRFLGALTYLGATPIKARDGTNIIDKPAFVALVRALVGDEEAWADLGSLLALITSKSGTSYATYLQRAKELDPPIGSTNELAVFLGTICEDAFLPADRTEIDQLRIDALTTSPRFATEFDLVVGGGACATWPAPASAPSSGTPPTGVRMLVVAATLDVRTPIEWARQISTRTGAPLVTWEGARHAVFGRDPCVNDAVNAFLLDPTIALPRTTDC